MRRFESCQSHEGSTSLPAHQICASRAKVDHHKPVTKALATRPCIDVDLPAPPYLTAANEPTQHTCDPLREAHTADKQPPSIDKVNSPTRWMRCRAIAQFSFGALGASLLD